MTQPHQHLQLLRRLQRVQLTRLQPLNDRVGLQQTATGSLIYYVKESFKTKLVRSRLKGTGKIGRWKIGEESRCSESGGEKEARRM